jgi:SRSO17 transposase
MRANPLRERPPEFWIPRAESFFAEFEDLFDVGVRGAETRRHGQEYLSALLLPLPEEVRKNAENLADRFPIPAHRLYQFLAYSPWDYRLVQERLARRMGAVFASPMGVVALDDTEFVKQGRASVGVAHQYCGVQGKVSNCQAAVSAQYVLPEFTYYPNLSSFLIGMELYLPEAWANDPARRSRTFVPEGVGYRPKWEMALSLVDRARALKLAHRAVVGDAGYGSIAPFRRELRERKEPYLVGLQPSGATRVEVRNEGKGRRIDTVIPEIPARQWTRVRWAEGSKGPLEMEVTRLRCRVWEKDRPTEEEGWLIFERRDNETKAYIAWGLDKLSLVEQLRVMRSRFPIEQSYQQMKEELGLDHFEGRSWRGWHHHVTMVGMAQGFLMLLRGEEGKRPKKDGEAPRKLPTIPKVRRYLNGLVATRFIRRIEKEPRNRVKIAVHMAQLLGAPIGLRKGRLHTPSLRELGEEE